MTSVPESPQLLTFLESEERFRPLADFFVENAIKEVLADSRNEANNEKDQVGALVRAGFGLVLERCHGAIGALSEYPIEQVFLRSVMLSFLRNGQSLVFMPAFRDTPADLADWQDQLEKLKEFTEWYKRRHGSDIVTDEFLNEQVRSGRMPSDEVPQIKELLLLYHYLPLRGAWHVGLQAKFPGLLRPRGTSRVDMLFWLPAPNSLRLVVECDGFSVHRFKSRFERDRRKDRALKAKGFDIFRFSGGEITANPIGIASELSRFLSEKEDGSRVV